MRPPKFRVTFATLTGEAVVATLTLGADADEATVKARDELVALGYSPSQLGEVVTVERVVKDEHGNDVFEVVA